MDPLRFILTCLAGWMNREQQAVIEYLREEICVLREHIPKKRIAVSDEQRCRLARKAVGFQKSNKEGNLVLASSRKVKCSVLVDIGQVSPKSGGRVPTTGGDYKL